MKNDIFNIYGNVKYDETIIRNQIHSYAPYTTIGLDTIDNIIINVNQESCYLYLNESGIYIEGTIDKEADANIEFVDNALCFLFDEIRLEMNNHEIDCCKNVGITACMKSYVSYSQNESKKYGTTGWGNTTLYNSTDKTFTGYIPLKLILGFAESYEKIILNQRLDLILTRSKNGKDAVMSTNDPKAQIKLTKVLWKIPHIHADDVTKLSLLSTYNSNKPITMAYKKWGLSYFPNLGKSLQGVWTIKSSSQLEKPRYIIFGFQTGRAGVHNKNSSQFDHLKLRNLKVYLNSESYPYENMNLEITKKKYMPLYLMYCNFQESYYNKVSEPFFDYKDFIEKAPLIVVDCSYQSELFKHNSSVDIRVEYELEEQAPNSTNLYALIIHDAIIKLLPLSNIVQKIM